MADARPPDHHYVAEEDSDAVMERLKEAYVEKETEEEYTRKFCGFQDTNMFGHTRPFRQPPLPDRAAIRARLAEQWELDNQAPKRPAEAAIDEAQPAKRARQDSDSQ